MKPSCSDKIEYFTALILGFSTSSSLLKSSAISCSSLTMSMATLAIFTIFNSVACWLAKKYPGQTSIITKV